MDAALALSTVVAAFERVHGRAPAPAEAWAVACVGRLETGWGTWAPFGGSHNWGAVQLCVPGKCKGAGPDGCPEDGLLHKDSRPNRDGSSTSYAVCFKRYPDDVAGASDLVKHLTTHRPLTRAVLGSGDAWRIAEAMYRERYFGGFGATDGERIEGYAKAMAAASVYLAKTTGRPALVRWSGRRTPLGASPTSGPASSAGAGWLLALAGIGLVVGFRR